MFFWRGVGSSHPSFLAERATLTFRTTTIIPRGWEGTPGMPPAPWSAYGLSSFSYAALGAWTYAHYGERPLFPGMHFEIALLFFQSACSYGCDVHTFGRPSLWKPVDRM